MCIFFNQRNTTAKTCCSSRRWQVADCADIGAFSGMGGLCGGGIPPLFDRSLLRGGLVIRVSADRRKYHHMTIPGPE